MGAVMAIERACFGRAAWPAEWLLEYARRFPEMFVVAVHGGRVVGYAAFAVARGWAELASIAVLPAWRSRGVATALLRRSLGTLRRRPVAGVSLMVRRGNDSAMRLYRSFGFARVRAVAGYYEDGTTGVRMRLRLNDF
jgi:ribosomal-protein-alanine N-acetyltransferase